MNRRVALRQLGMITAGAMILPSCVKEARKLSITLKNILITGDQEALLADVVGTIIPTTDIPGASDLRIHEFVLRMVDDCHDAESQQQFVTGLSQLDEVTKKRFDKSFSECSVEERLALFGELEEKKGADEKKEVEKMSDGKENQLPAFYSIAKRHTIRGYLSSEYIMTNVLVHNMIPGRYNGCIEIKDKNDLQTVIG
jgi:Gluconate 2-dehydrogenase subunit 3